MPSPTRSIRAPQPFWDSLYNAAEAEGLDPNTLLKRIVSEALAPQVMAPPPSQPPVQAPSLPRFLR